MKPYTVPVGSYIITSSSAPTDRPAACRTGDVVLDCGANVGSFARMAAPVVGPKGVIYAVEPIPDVCVALERNIAEYEKWAAKKGQKVGKVIAVNAGM